MTKSDKSKTLPYTILFYGLLFGAICYKKSQSVEKHEPIRIELKRVSDDVPFHEFHNAILDAMLKNMQSEG
ncbi:hypothetical protein RD00_19330 [Pseudomonas amygdali pv. tabaci]|nr:hypothetical protein RD00_19330 [Pseudomonas amygdali pv. tabaci]